jgi:hypothetical protein
MNQAIFTVFVLLLAITISRGEEPPANMQDHFRWCAAAKTASESIARHEGFWRKYLPADEGGVRRADGDGSGYGDAPHVMHVRLCAYRLLTLYIDAHNQDRVAYFAKWLEATDPVIGVKPSKIPQQDAKGK